MSPLLDWPERPEATVGAPVIKPTEDPLAIPMAVQATKSPEQHVNEPPLARYRKKGVYKGGGGKKRVIRTHLCVRFSCIVRVSSPP